MKRFLHCSKSMSGRVVVLTIFLVLAVGAVASAGNPGEARKALAQMNIEYGEQQFAKAAGAGDMTAVQLFVDAGMDVNSGGGAAIGLAAGRGQTEMVKWLLGKGAKPTANALQFARTRGHKDIEDILVAAGAKE